MLTTPSFVAEAIRSAVAARDTDGGTVILSIEDVIFAISGVMARQPEYAQTPESERLRTIQDSGWLRLDDAWAGPGQKVTLEWTIPVRYVFSPR